MVVVTDSKIPEHPDNGPPPSYMDAPPEYDNTFGPTPSQPQASTSSSATRALPPIPLAGSPVAEDTPIAEPEYSRDAIAIDKISLFQLYGDIKGVLQTQSKPK
jgi:hypothetical protein